MGPDSNTPILAVHKIRKHDDSQSESKTGSPLLLGRPSGCVLLDPGVKTLAKCTEFESGSNGSDTSKEMV